MKKKAWTSSEEDILRRYIDVTDFPLTEEAIKYLEERSVHKSKSQVSNKLTRLRRLYMKIERNDTLLDAVKVQWERGESPQEIAVIVRLGLKRLIDAVTYLKLVKEGTDWKSYIPETQYCVTCKTLKPGSEFPLRPESPIGIMSECKKCWSERSLCNARQLKRRVW